MAVGADTFYPATFQHLEKADNKSCMQDIKRVFNRLYLYLCKSGLKRLASVFKYSLYKIS